MSERAVLISIQPKWCELISNGKKTIEVRKTKPKLETPFKVYIYCTEKDYDKFFCVDKFMHRVFLNGKGKRKVIGEFVCDRIDDFYCCTVPYKKENNLGYGRFLDNGVYKVDGWHEGVVFERNDRYIDSMLKNNDLKEMCLSAQEIFDYIGIGKYLYAWHISDLKIYDKPKALSEFTKYMSCKHYYDCCACHNWDRLNLKCIAMNNEVKRPPQSYMSVEPLKENADD